MLHQPMKIETFLSIEEFGNRLLLTGDLDPLYIMLHNSDLDMEQKERFCIAYWCFYHAGVAFRLAEVPKSRFWTWMMEAARNEDKLWPRGTERRHFRGKAGIQSVAHLSSIFQDPNHLTDLLRKFDRFDEMSKMVQTWTGFGPWIAFKVADMMERVLAHPVDFSSCRLNFYQTPLEGARLACHHWKETTDQPVAYAVWRLLNEFGSLKAPPDDRRSVDIQEIETILCKWKSHMGGHYPVGKDTKEIRHGLTGWGETAERAKLWLP